MNNNLTTNLHFRLSEAITWLRFPLIFLIILLHCYSVERIPGEHELYFKAVYPMALWLGETGVPGFFFISGYLFFLSKKSYGEKLRSRVHSLLIPYLLWNSLLLGLYILAYIAGFPQDINGKDIAEFTAMDYLRVFWDRGSYDNGNFVPILCPFWYIRNLIITCILSPLLYYIIRYTREMFLIAVAAWWMMTPHNAFIPQTILFFSLGAYFSILNYNPLEITIKRKWLFFGLFTVFALGDIYMHTVNGTPINLQIHRLSLIFNIPMLLLLADYCCRRNLTNSFFPNAAFIVFAVHYPIVVMLRKFCIGSFASANDGIQILLYLACVVIATTASLAFYWILERYFPIIKNILSGNR